MLDHHGKQPEGESTETLRGCAGFAMAGIKEIRGARISLVSGQRTSISRKFSGGPYISSKDCWRASGKDCIPETLSCDVCFDLERGRQGSLTKYQRSL